MSVWSGDKVPFVALITICEYVASTPADAVVSFGSVNHRFREVATKFSRSMWARFYDELRRANYQQYSENCYPVEPPNSGARRRDTFHAYLTRRKLQWSEKRTNLRGEPLITDIEGCAIEFDFQCPIASQQLVMRADGNAFCDVCEKQVFLCHTAEQVSAAAAKRRCVMIPENEAELLRQRNELGEERVNIGLCVQRGEPQQFEVAKKILAWASDWMRSAQSFVTANDVVVSIWTKPNIWSFRVVEIDRAAEAGADGHALAKDKMPPGGWSFLFVLPPAVVLPAAQGTPLNALQRAGRVIRFNDEMWSSFVNDNTITNANDFAFQNVVGKLMHESLMRLITSTPPERPSRRMVKGKVARPRPLVQREGPTWQGKQEEERLIKLGLERVTVDGKPYEAPAPAAAAAKSSDDDDLEEEEKEDKSSCVLA